MKRLPPSIAAIVVLALALLLRPSASAGPLAAAADSVYLPLIVRPPDNGQTPDQYQVALQVLSLVNSERAAHGCPAVAWNVQLTAAAQGQSRDMAELNFFSHTNPNPAHATADDRVRAADYGGSFTGENIAAGYSSAAAVMQGWMNSPGHRDNILNCASTQIGIGYYYQADDQPFSGSGPYYYYWTQVFGQ
jgi:uncharacterized protein YkwD